MNPRSAMDPVTGLPPIPAMTSQAERECYYRLAREAEGAVIEFGSWLGAATAYLAVAGRETGRKIHTYDKFETKKSHIRKVKEFREKHGTGVEHADACQHLLANLGPLAEHVIIHRGKIEAAAWDYDPIGLIVFDAPKRVPTISAVLTNFRNGIRKGTVMAWQDFCHFPSYEIPACLYRLRDHFEFTEAVFPGSTLVFRVKSVWKPEEVTREALSLGTWTPAEIDSAWTYWLDGRVPAEKARVFRCGKAMFLCDLAKPKLAVAALEAALADKDREVLKKWAYLRKVRHDFYIRYRPLFAFIGEERLAA